MKKQKKANRTEQIGSLLLLILLPSLGCLKSLIIKTKKSKFAYNADRLIAVDFFCHSKSRPCIRPPRVKNKLRKHLNHFSFSYAVVFCRFDNRLFAKNHCRSARRRNSLRNHFLRGNFAFKSRQAVYRFMV